MAFPAFIILCMQNDLCHPEGVYARHGLKPAHIPHILPNIVKTALFCKEQRIPVIASSLSIITDLEGNACIGGVKKIRPFLAAEGFRKNTWGHDLLEEIPTPNYTISQWGMSPFYQTELSYLVQALGIDTLILSGFTTNGSVESCARECSSRGLRAVTLTDCVASYSDALHQGSLINLGSFGKIMSSEDWVEQFEKSLHP